MKAHHYLAVFVRLFAIFLFAFSLKDFSYLLQLVLFDEEAVSYSSVIYAFVGPFVLFFISVFLWAFPVCLAQSILNTEKALDIEPLNKSTFFSLAVSILGLYMTAYALVDVFYYFSLWKLSNSSDIYALANDLFSPNQKANVLATILELIFGLLLIFKSKTVAKKIFQLSS